MESRERANLYFEKLVDLSFFLYVFIELMFRHSRLAQASLLLFIVMSTLYILTKLRVVFSSYFTFSALFVLYNYYIISEGYALNSSVALDMLNTLIKNFIILFFVYNYTVLRGGILKVICIYKKSIFIYTLCAFILSVPMLFRSRLGGNFTFLGMEISLNSNAIAMMSSYVFLMYAYHWLCYKKNTDIMRGLWFALIVLLTGSRKGLLIIILGLIVLIQLMEPKKILKNLFIFTIAGIFFYNLILKVPQLYDVIGYRIEAMAQLIEGESYNEASLVSRVSYVELGWDMYRRRPWTGYGLDCFRLFRKAYGTYSHNNYIEMLVSGGNIAFLLYYLPHIIFIFKGLLSKRQKNDITNLVLAISILILVSDYGVVSYFDRSILTLQIFGFAQLHYLKYAKSSGSKGRSQLIYEPSKQGT